jgi:hypothetical protein
MHNGDDDNTNTKIKRLVHQGACRVLAVKVDGGDEVVAQPGKAEDLGAAIDTGVHRPPRRVITQRYGAACGKGPTRQVPVFGAQPPQGAIDGIDKATMGFAGIFGDGIQVGYGPAKHDLGCPRSTAPRHDETAIGARRWSRQQHIGVTAGSSGLSSRDAVRRQCNPRRTRIGTKPCLRQSPTIHIQYNQMSTLEIDSKQVSQQQQQQQRKKQH